MEYIQSESNGHLGVNIDYDGIIGLDASKSDVHIEGIEVYNLQNVRIDNGEFNEESQSIEIFIQLSGRYQFNFVADSDGMIEIDVQCTPATSSEPTTDPTRLPTSNPNTISSANQSAQTENSSIVLMALLGAFPVLFVFIICIVYCFVQRRQKGLIAELDEGNIATDIATDTQIELQAFTPDSLSIPGHKFHKTMTSASVSALYRSKSGDDEMSAACDEDVNETQTGHNGEEGFNEYQRIEQILDLIYDGNHEKYLQNFKKEMINDQKLFDDENFTKIHPRDAVL